MKALLLPVLVGLPLAAQTNTGNTEQLLDIALLRGLRNSSRPYLLVIEDGSKPMADSFRKLLQEDDIADFSLIPRFFYRNREGSNNIIGDAVQKHFNFSQETRWAVVDSSERRLASGQDMPSAAELARQLADAGVQSPMRVLRNFLRIRTDHLEARLSLLRLQRESAQLRTRAALNLELGVSSNDLVNDFVMELMSGASSPARLAGLSDILLNRPKPEPIPKDKVLEAVLDLQIWGGYAESFDRLLTGDDWIVVGLSFDTGDSSLLEVCSPLVKGLYRRKIGQVEAALERAPLNYRLWSVWIRMADVIGDRSILAVADRLTLGPGAGFSSWPYMVKSGLIEDARANNKWGYLADSLWGEYENRLRTGPGASGTTVSFSPDRRNAMMRLMDPMFSQEWNSLFEPLLEALINMNDLGRADSIMNALKEEQQRGQWSETQMQKAIGLANRCNRPDVAQRWSIYITEINN